MRGNRALVFLLCAVLLLGLVFLHLIAAVPVPAIGLAVSLVVALFAGPVCNRAPQSFVSLLRDRGRAPPASL